MLASITQPDQSPWISSLLTVRFLLRLGLVIILAMLFQLGFSSTTNGIASLFGGWLTGSWGEKFWARTILLLTRIGFTLWVLAFVLTMLMILLFVTTFFIQNFLIN